MRKFSKTKEVVSIGRQRARENFKFHTCIARLLLTSAGELFYDILKLPTLAMFIVFPIYRYQSRPNSESGTDEEKQ